MAKILVAASPAPRIVLERILAGHELSCVETMVQAEQLLRERTFDLIVCTIAFDESKMFDLLRQVKSSVLWQQIPFVCARVRADVLRSPIAMEGVAFTCQALGATAVLDIANYQADAEQEMRAAIDELLHTTSKQDA